MASAPGGGFSFRQPFPVKSWNQAYPSFRPTARVDKGIRKVELEACASEAPSSFYAVKTSSFVSKSTGGVSSQANDVVCCSAPKLGGCIQRKGIRRVVC